MSQCGFKVEFGRGWIYCQRDANPPHHVHRFEFSMGEDEVAAPASPGPEPRAMEGLTSGQREVLDRMDATSAAWHAGYEAGRAEAERTEGAASPGERRPGLTPEAKAALGQELMAWADTSAKLKEHSNPQIAGLLINHLWSGMDLGSPQELLLSEAIDRLQRRRAPAAPPAPSGPAKEEP